MEGVEKDSYGAGNLCYRAGSENSIVQFYLDYRCQIEPVNFDEWPRVYTNVYNLFSSRGPRKLDFPYIMFGAVRFIK